MAYIPKASQFNVGLRSYKAEGSLQEIMHHFTLQRSRLDISNKVYFIRNIPYSPNPIEQVFLLLKTCFRKIRLQKAISGEICSITSCIKDTLKLVNIETVQRLCRSGHARWKIRSFLDLEKQGYWIWQIPFYIFNTELKGPEELKRIIIIQNGI